MNSFEERRKRRALYIAIVLYYFSMPIWMSTSPAIRLTDQVIKLSGFYSYIAAIVAAAFLIFFLPWCFLRIMIRLVISEDRSGSDSGGL